MNVKHNLPIKPLLKVVIVHFLQYQLWTIGGILPTKHTGLTSRNGEMTKKD